MISLANNHSDIYKIPTTLSSDQLHIMCIFLCSWQCKHSFSEFQVNNAHTSHVFFILDNKFNAIH